MQLSKELKAYIIISVLLTAALIALYAYQFNNSHLSKNVQDWSDFGGYVSGATAPILGLLNLIVLIRLTLAIDNSDNKRLLTELRFNLYKEISEKINNVGSKQKSIGRPPFKPDKKGLEKITALNQYLNNMSLVNKYMFNANEQISLDLIYLSIRSILGHIELTTKSIIDITPYEEHGSALIQLENFKVLNEYLEKFDVVKLDLLICLLNSTMHKKINDSHFKEKYSNKNGSYQ